ncbi:hypothetical protein [Carnobacterium maltaromaticum]|uniref:hypothetical protein n=1 Tax=Carnobacterium maltaromaticum TaxID=2751 RepID=UPI0039AEE4F1
MKKSLVEWASEEFKRVTKLEVSSGEIGYESIELEREELDENLLPKNVKDFRLPDNLLIHFFQVDGNPEGKEETEVYLQLYILANPVSNKWLLVGFVTDHQLTSFYEPEECR